MRKSGILLPIASLPSKYGIGCFSKEAYEFVDRLKQAGQSYWQILPMGPTGYGDSPYQSFSTFAGNPYFIDLEDLIQEGYLTKQECDACDFGADSSSIDYAKLYTERFQLLRAAYRNSGIGKNKRFKAFVRENAAWLNDYALYMAIKNAFGGISWSEWDEDIKLRKPDAMKKYKKELREEIEFYQSQQYLFQKQWTQLKSYANGKGIRIIGDIPIYVAFDSADAWAGPELFQFDEQCLPTAVAGCPPDAFSADGQLWGNPLYRWEYHAETGYQWWIARMKHCQALYDIIRIDHFRGFDAYYAIPYGAPNARNGKWEEGPGYAFFQALEGVLGETEIIAEDLGFLTESVYQLVEKTGFPGMKILQFAFDSREESDYLPHHYKQNCVVYPGTHDNDTIQGWYRSMNRADRKFCRKYLHIKKENIPNLHWAMIRAAMSSVADMAIVPMQDYLGLGSEARINIPSTVGGNWVWRMSKQDFTKKLAGKIRKMTVTYKRI